MLLDTEPAVMVCHTVLSLLICSSRLAGKKSIPNIRDANRESEVMVFSLPMSRVREASFLNHVNMVSHAV